MRKSAFLRKEVRVREGMNSALLKERTPRSRRNVVRVQEEFKSASEDESSPRLSVDEVRVFKFAVKSAFAKR